MKILSNRINKINESSTMIMAAKAKKMMNNGIDIINLSIGELDFDIAQHIKDAAKIAIDNNISHYSPVPGYDDLRLSIVNKLKKDNNLDFDINNIIVSTGAKQSIFNLVISIINCNDEVIIPKPYWVSYSEIVKIANGKCIFIDTNIKNNFKITKYQLENAITDKTKLFMFSSPANPTGSVYNEKELEELAEVFTKYPNVYIMSDEIYEFICYKNKHVSIGQYKNLKDRTIIINGCSKGNAMTGWRIGYLAGPKHIVNACIKIQGHSTSGACSIAQKAAIKAIDCGVDKNMIKELENRRNLVYSILSTIKEIKINKPEGAFYFFIDISFFYGKKYNNHIINNACDFTDLLLKYANIVVVSGKDFGNNKYIRLSYSVNTIKLKIAIQNLKLFINNIK